MTTTAAHRQRGFLLSLLTLLTLLGVLLATPVNASASTRVATETRVRANDHPTAALVGRVDPASSTTVGVSSDPLRQLVSATGVATEAAAVGEDIVGTSHNALRPTQDWIDPAAVDEYAAQLRAGEQVPPIDVQRLPDGREFILDGHHRYVASQQTGIPVPIEVTTGPGPVGLPDWLKVFYLGQGG